MTAQESPMQQIDSTKSLLYGAVMMLILFISSCEFGINPSELTELDTEHTRQALPALSQSSNTKH